MNDDRTDRSQTGVDEAELEIDTRTDPSGDPVIALAGELDMSTADPLERTVAAVTAGAPARLIFDLSELRFMDSAGIAVLVGATRKVDRVNLRNPSPIVARVIELTGLSDVLPIES